jgi:hypothetical protein
MALRSYGDARSLRPGTTYFPHSSCVAVAVGSHPELIARGGLDAGLFDLQARFYH